MKRRNAVFLSNGNIVDAVLASCSLPPLFPPYRIGRTKYIDGCLNKNIGLEKAKSLNCDLAILVNSTTHKIPLSIVSYIKRRAIMKSIDNEVKNFDKELIKIDIPFYYLNIAFNDFRYTKILIESGEKEANSCIKNLKTYITQKNVA
ncbi:hypothetical protein DRO69_14320 [Candidatus Bathyarchaeota archaeon]|nr:MAG: hypothetical protein DRO69_14320 [Candidatus Bathyarchaeota archaeon]